MLRLSFRRPALLVGAGYALVLLLLLATHGWDARFFATLGPQWLRHDPGDGKASDGIIFHAIAEQPFGREVPSAYRKERILYPLLAHVLALGQPVLVPWALVLLNWIAIVAGTEILHRLLLRSGAPGWMALAYGAWAGLGLALLRDTAEPVTYASALLGIWWLGRGQTWLAYPAFFGALLGRETALLLVVPYMFLGDTRRGWLRRWLPGLLVLGLWQLYNVALRLHLHGSPSPEKWFWLWPFRSIRWIRPFDLPFTLIFLVVPAVVTLVLIVRPLRRTPMEPALWAAALNALLVLSLPPRVAELVWHSARVSTGLVAALVLATSLRETAPRTWRLLMALFVGSSAWTLAAVVRYLFWDVVVIPGG